METDDNSILDEHQLTEGSEEDQLFEAYFQKDADYYMTRLARMRRGTRIMFNPYALILGIVWMVFRKMYLAALVIFLFLIAEGYLEEYLYATTEMYHFKSWINLGVTVVSAVVIGLYANYVYVRIAEREVERARQKFDTHEHMLAWLKKRGGTSMIAVVILLAFYVVFGLILASVM